MMDESWRRQLAAEFQQPYFRSLADFLKRERKEHVVYPPPDQLFTALRATPYHKVKAVILGQDPYHGPGQAHGLSFSVRPGIRLPPSLQNIYKELEQDVRHRKVRHGYLMAWAERGVLLLNSALTVREAQPGSHAEQWKPFTDAVIHRLSMREQPVVFVLWGKHAREKAAGIDAQRHPIVESVHPSPMSAHHGFFGSKPFSQVNTYLEALGQTPIDWQVPEAPYGKPEGYINEP
jgi:uracil-DNA glycosylase